MRAPGSYLDDQRRAAAGWTPGAARPASQAASPRAPFTRPVRRAQLRPSWRLAIGLLVGIAVATAIAELAGRCNEIAPQPSSHVTAGRVPR